MTTHDPRWRVAIAVLTTSLIASLWACWLPRPAPPSLLDDRDAAPPEIRAACDLAQLKCTRCHTTDRIRMTHVTSPSQWHAYVTRMRRQPGSGIDARDGDAIVRCLVYRTFGGDP